MDPSRAPVAFGRLAVPQLFAELQQPQEQRRLPALASLCDLLHDPELIHQTINGGTTRAPICAPPFRFRRDRILSSAKIN